MNPNEPEVKLTFGGEMPLSKVKLDCEPIEATWAKGDRPEFIEITVCYDSIRSIKELPEGMEPL